MQFGGQQDSRDDSLGKGGDLAVSIVTMLFAVLILAGSSVSVQVLRKKHDKVKKKKRQFALAMNAVIVGLSAIMTLYATYDVGVKSMRWSDAAPTQSQRRR